MYQPVQTEYGISEQAVSACDHRMTSQLLGKLKLYPNPKGKCTNGYQFCSLKINEAVMHKPVVTLTASHM